MPQLTASSYSYEVRAEDAEEVLSCQRGLNLAYLYEIKPFPVEINDKNTYWPSCKNTRKHTYSSIKTIAKMHLKNSTLSPIKS